MLYMVIERFRAEAGGIAAVGERFRAKGRMMPASVAYITSWLTPDGRACYQVMDAPDRPALDEWIRNWSDLVDFEVHEIVTSQAFWAGRG